MALITSGQVEVNTSKFTWKVEKFSTLCSNVKDQIQSPLFQINDLNEYKWKIGIHPYGDQDSVKGFLSIYLFNNSQKQVDICFKVILSDVTGRLIKSLKTNNNFPSTKGFGWPEFIKRDTLLQIGLPNDTLNITCIIANDMYSVEKMYVDETMCNDYESLLSDESLSDMTITIKTRKIKVHKAILSARSRVFAAMFSHDMKENNTNSVRITDVTYDIMKELLRFIYCGKVNDLKKNAKALVAAAEKYEVTDLKILCEYSIWKNIKIEDACDILTIADLYNCIQLKSQIIDYIVSNIKEVSATPKFKTLNRSNPGLFEEITFKIVEKKC